MLIRRKLILFLGAFALVVSISGAGEAQSTKTTSVKLRSGKLVDDVEIRSGRPAGADVTINGIVINSSTLNEVRRKFGRQNTSHVGDAGDSIYSLCYYGSDGVKVVFESGEMGGKKQVVNSVRLYTKKAAGEADSPCLLSPIISSSVKVGRLALRSQIGQVEKIFGRPSKRFENVSIYLFEENKRHKDADWITVTIFEIEIEDGWIGAIHVSQSTEVSR